MWTSAAQLVETYAVSALTLELYRQRGSLPTMVVAGQTLYDAAAVATIFRKRSALPLSAPPNSFGRLGEVTLGNTKGRPTDRAAPGSSPTLTY